VIGRRVGGWRMKEPAGIIATVVNGEVVMENGKHTGALPGRVLCNTYYYADHARAEAKKRPLPELRAVFCSEAEGQQTPR
jgi:hypothetical protein